MIFHINTITATQVATTAKSLREQENFILNIPNLKKIAEIQHNLKTDFDNGQQAMQKIKEYTRIPI